MFLIAATAQAPKSRIFASEESERCQAGIYCDEYEDRGLRCARFEDHNDLHMSDRKEAGGTSLAWVDSSPGATAHYLARPSADEARILRSRELDPRHPIVKFFRPWRHS